MTHAAIWLPLSLLAWLLLALAAAPLVGRWVAGMAAPCRPRRACGNKNRFGGVA